MENREIAEKAAKICAEIAEFYEAIHNKKDELERLNENCDSEKLSDIFKKVHWADEPGEFTDLECGFMGYYQEDELTV